jgi:sec-independent protein translocase protein TatA
MGPVGVQEMIVIFLVALVLFGPKKLPELGRTLGKALTEFRRAKNELKASFETHLNELEREARQSGLQSSNTVTDYSPPRYSHPYEDYGHPSDESSLSESHAIATAEPPAISAPAAEYTIDSHDVSSSETSPVAGTVPRSNGFHAGRLVPPSTEHDAASESES